MIKKNISLLLLCTAITIFGAQEKQILAIFRSYHDNKVIIQAGVAKHTMFRPQMDGQLQRVEEADCVHADLEPVVGLSFQQLQIV